MDFIIYNLNWYKKRLEHYSHLQESGVVTRDIIHEAKILHKFLEDIRDEGYIPTYELFQDKLQATRLLTEFIMKHNDKPFELIKKAPIYDELVYGKDEKSLEQYIDAINLLSKTTELDNQTDNFLYDKILGFSKWVYNSIKPDTTVVFLLRDTLLPYLAFRQWSDNNTIKALPLLIGRRFLCQFGDGDVLYNSISDALYMALHEADGSPSLFQESVVRKIKKVLAENQTLKRAIEEIMSGIKAQKICVVETGVHGTMPLLLKACDERIDQIMLYTTLPWMYDAWGECCYTKSYEDLRLFETVNCQDLLFSFSSVKGRAFYIREIADDKVKKESIKELCLWNQLISARREE